MAFLYLLLSSYGARGAHCDDSSCSSVQAVGCGLQKLGTQAQQLRLPGSRAQPQYLWPMSLAVSQHVGSSRTGIELVSPALAGRFITNEPPGKPLIELLKRHSKLASKSHLNNLWMKIRCSMTCNQEIMHTGKDII